MCGTSLVFEAEPNSLNQPRKVCRSTHFSLCACTFVRLSSHLWLINYIQQEHVLWQGIIDTDHVAKMPEPNTYHAKQNVVVHVWLRPQLSQAAVTIFILEERQYQRSRPTLTWRVLSFLLPLTLFAAIKWLLLISKCITLFLFSFLLLYFKSLLYSTCTYFIVLISFYFIHKFFLFNNLFSHLFYPAFIHSFIHTTFYFILFLFCICFCFILFCIGFCFYFTALYYCICH